VVSDGGLVSLMSRFAGRTPLDRVLWNPLEPGLRIGVLPPGVDEPRMLADLLNAVRFAWIEENHGRQPLPLLLVLHEGLVALENGMFRGPAVKAVRRLGQARLTRPFAVVVSRRVFEDLASLDRQPFPVARFHPVRWEGIPAFGAEWPL